MTAERLLHAVFGNNVVVGPHVRRQLECLRACLPAHFRGRRMDDLGCGDGKLTALLTGIFEPASVRGFDVNPALVRRARSKGIDARVLDLEMEMPAGDLGVVWGVLHHLRDPAGCLARIRTHYGLVFVREPVRSSSSSRLELGSPLPPGELRNLLCDSLPGSRVVMHEGCAFAFYEARGTHDQGAGPQGHR